MNLIVMTFNLRINVPSDGENAWPNRVGAVIETIKKSEAVIIGVQEGSPSMIRDLEEKLTEYDWVGEGRRGGMNDELTAIFYKKDIFDVIDTGTFWLSETPEVPASQSWNSAYPRICTWTKLKHIEGIEIYFYNTHLDNISDDARLNGIKLITERISLNDSKEKLPVMLTGDFNIEPDSSVVEYLRNFKIGGRTMKNAYNEGLAGSNTRPGLTFHDFKGGDIGEPIDYIYVSSDIKIKELFINRNKVNGKYPSDHYPVSAVIEI